MGVDVNSAEMKQTGLTKVEDTCAILVIKNTISKLIFEIKAMNCLITVFAFIFEYYVM